MARGLQVDNVSVKRGELVVVRDVSLACPPGAVTVLLGANGAGKTSLLDGIAGVIPIASGSVSVDGTAIQRLTRERRARGGLAYVEQGRAVFPELTTEENLMLALSRGGDIQEAFKLFPELIARRKVQAQLLSGGEQQMLVLARALVSRPTVLLIDEMSQGLAPVIVKRLLPIVESAARNGIAVLLVEQYAPLALSIGDVAYVMNVGRVVIQQQCSQLLRAPDLLHAAYLAAELTPGDPSPDGHRDATARGSR